MAVGTTLTAIATSIVAEWRLLDVAHLQYWRRDVAQFVLIGLAASAAIVLLIRAAILRKPGTNQIVLPAILRGWSESRLSLIHI